MASLRARLLAAVLVLAAAGLLLVGAIVYAEQRSFLYQRVDEQARSAPPAAAHALAERGIGPALEEHDRDRDHGRAGAGSPPGDGDGGPPNVLPLGTYAERRDASGRVLGHGVAQYGQAVTADPALPKAMPVGKLLTVHGKGKDDKRYRVFAGRDPSGVGTTIVAIPLTEVDQTLRRLLAVLALVILGVLALLGVAAWGVVRVGLLPLDRMGHTAGAIAGGDLSHRVESTDPRTEVGRLGIARRARKDRLRVFLADASHELRTPLASIRGYAELFRMGAARDPDDVAKAMRRIEEEAARMGVLVEDLLMLARLDEVADAPHTEVDLGRLVGDAADDARATAPDREIASAVEGETTVLGDAHQLRQVLANLMRNALVHAPAV